MVDALEYYAVPGLMTDPKECGVLFDELPIEIPALCQVVQGILVHIFWAERQGLSLLEERRREVNVRSVARKLALIKTLNGSPLVIARPLEERLVGNCRDFSTMLCAMLRYQKVPARARCGFAAYFEPGKYEDHWVCEYWSVQRKRWVMVDPQLDAFQRQTLQIKFDPYDMASGHFLSGGKAWQLCRTGETDPNLFGIFQWRGLGFVQGNLLRDLAALNKVELLPWDSWGLIERGVEKLSLSDMEFLDHIAELTLGDNSAFSVLRSTYEKDVRLRVPSNIGR
jgi:hypothetical protein